MKAIPSIQDLYTKLESDIQTRLNLVPADLKFVVDAMSAVLSAQLKLCYLYLQDIQDNQFPDTADTAADGGTLERQGMIQLNRLPFPAIAGVYTATVTGTVGAVIPASLVFQSDENSNAPGNLYILDSEYIMPGSTGTITLRALSAGADYLLNPGDVVIPTQPVLGISPQQAVIATVTTNPADGESIDVYRQNIINAYQLQPQGGAKTDYRLWAADADGVRTVYPYVENGQAGTVQIFVEAVTSSSTDGNGTPSPSLLAAVAAVIEFNPDTTLPTNMRGRRPIQANVVCLAVTPTPIDIAIQGLQVNTAAIQAEVIANLKSYLYTVRPYIAGCDLPQNENDLLTSVQLQSVVLSSIGTGNTFLGFTMYVNGVATNSYTFALNFIPYLRNVNYI